MYLRKPLQKAQVIDTLQQVKALFQSKSGAISKEPRVATQPFEDDIFAELDFTDMPANRRRSVRYAFSDLTGHFESNSIIKWNKRKDVVILDISSKGALIECEEGLKLKVKGGLILEFALESAYRISGQIVRKIGNTYGIRFDKYNHELNDYLVSSGKSFLIKGDM